MFGLFSVPANCVRSGFTVFSKRFTGSSGSFSVFGQTGICIERYSWNGSDTRTVAMLSNEASLLVQEEVSDAAGVNLAMRKGVNYPQGPLDWAEQWGFFLVVETLDNLRKFYGERYQVSSWLQQKAKQN